MKALLTIVWLFALSFSIQAGYEFDLIRGNTSWLARRGLTPAAYQKVLDDYSKKGYRPSDVEIWAGGNTKRYALTMVKDNKSTVLKTSLDSAAFSAKWNEMNQKGYRLIDQESYSFKGKQYYGGLWIKNTPFIPWRSHRNQTLASFKTAFDKNRADGYMPIDVEAYLINGKRYFSSIWVKNKGYTWRLNKAVPASNIAKFISDLNKEGKRVIDFNSYIQNGKIMYAVIGAKDKSRSNWGYRLVRTKRANDFRNRTRSLKDFGFRLDSYDVIKKGNDFFYSGVFSLNNPERANWNKRKDVYDKVNAWFGSEKPAGMTTVVAHKGKIRFIRGWGSANLKNKTNAHGETVYRIASISKAISGILGFRLEDKGVIDLTRNIRANGYLTELPSKHGVYTVGDLLTCRSEVAHYNTSDAINNGGQFNNAWSAVKKFKDWDLVDDEDGYVYSTPGYTIFAAALEKKTGKNFCTLLKSEISNPFGINSLACENKNRSTSEKSEIYSQKSNGDVFKVKKPRNISWKYAGGGLEANAVDLAKLGMKLLGTKIMSTARREEMTTDTLDGSASYAYGWNYGSHDSYDWFAKSGAQEGARTYMRVYPDEDLVIVNLVNVWTDGRLEGLTEDIALDILK